MFFFLFFLPKEASSENFFKDQLLALILLTVYNLNLEFILTFTIAFSML